MTFKILSHKPLKTLANICLSLLIAQSLIACSSPMNNNETVPPPTNPDTNSNPAQANALCGDLKTTLSPEEQEYAKVAWQYFVKNRQATTGFTNAADQYPSGTLWDQGNYLMALNAARWLGLVDQPEFDQQLNEFLTTLGKLPLVENALPNKVYNSATAAMVDYGNQPTTKGLGWSALDIGRFLTALHIIRTCHPQYNDWISGIISGWQLARSVQDGQLFGAAIAKDGSLELVQEGRLGYEEYAARGYQLWGFDVTTALERSPMKRVKVAGVEIPVDTRDYQTTNANNYVVSESFILEAIEHGWDDQLAQDAAAVLQAQSNRYDETGLLTAVSEDNIDQAPHFLYNTIYANGKEWAVITDKNKPYPQLRTLSTKAAFGWYYLFPDNPYTSKLLAAVQNLQAPDDKGFYTGIYEKNKATNTILTGNTNGLILEILYYKALGNQAILKQLSSN